ncbi:hypothetical protein [Stenotrophomonas sp.]|uniref:hypothetical protein n=1 Tax=Stenotrophomonas sp. TaxID=69392 RepID=UPI0028AAF31D|nr:hypothetical protein [Stenotrophomonas sp.]
MSVTHKDLRNYAAGIAETDCDETHIRSSISRSYYAAFHAALPLVGKLPECSKIGDAARISHHEMGERLRAWDVGRIDPRLAKLKVTARTLATAMKAARAARVQADYDIDIDLVKADARAQVERTSKILRMILQIEGEIQRPAASVQR